MQTVIEPESELEKGESSAIPFLIITVLVFAIASAVLYFVLEPRKLPSAEEATRLVTNALNAEGPTTVRFHTGQVKDRPGENPRDPRYRLLQEAGVLEVASPVGSRTPVSLTDRGSEILSGIVGMKRSKDADGTDAYVVPLAVRRVVDITHISMEGAEQATIEYTWEWQPNVHGEIFDRLGPAVTLMTAADQLELVNKFAVRFYHAVPKEEMIRAIKSPHGWQLEHQ
jgi:hypothetical protein